VTRAAFDKLNRMTLMTDPQGGQTSFTYDGNSNLLSLTDALSHPTSYSYDSGDRVDTKTDPLTHDTSYQYDRKGHFTQVTDRKGQITLYTYDALDRVDQVTYNDLSTIAYTYDAGDRVLQVVDSVNGTMSRQYDDLDRMTQETTPQGTVSYTYDADGRRATMTVTGQSAVTYVYDDAHRLTSISKGTATVTLTYDAANRRSTVTYPNAVVGTYAYDAASQVVGITYTSGATTLGDLTYTYDAAGNRTRVGGSWATVGLPSALSSATHDAANRINSYGGVSFTYDANGNLTGDGTSTYAWNARNQLVGLSGATAASFAYDAFGRRRAKTVAGNTTRFLYDRLNSVQEQSSGGTPTANLLTGGTDETFTRTESSGTSTVLTDALGSALSLTDASGAVQTQYTFEPFGATTSSGASSTNVAQFTGRENDLTGLYFYRARFYSPLTQRFISEDPADGIAGGSLYAYVGNAPTLWVDPLGLQLTPPPFPVPGGGPNSSWKWNPDPRNPRGGTWGPNTPIPDQSQPSASEDPNGHWDIDDGLGSPRRHTDPKGNPLTPEEAHRRPPPNPQPTPCPESNPAQEPNRPMPKPPLFPWLPWRLPIPFPIIINPCLIDPFLPMCNPMGLKKGEG
jgi:RHS repeat-associated protein